MAQRSNAKFVIGLLAILAVIPIAYFAFTNEPETPPPPPRPKPVAAMPDAGPATPIVRLAEVQGSVEVRRGADGGWLSAQEGDQLVPSDAIRTNDESSAKVVGEDLWEVRMESGTEVRVGELTQSMSQLYLATGMARATVRGAGRHTFEVRSVVGDASATTDGGVFSISTNGQGTVAVGTEEGEVAFVGSGRLVIVRAGEQSLVKPGGEGPSAPAPIPTSLLLKVAFPNKTLTNVPKIVLRGDVEPGAMVEVQGRVVRADQNGHFEADVRLHEGKNTLSVDATGSKGRTQTSSKQITLDTKVKAPKIDPNMWK